jgi:hypothetical protein
VYLDSSHEYTHTLEELEILKHKVKPSGVIAGDDWQAEPSHRHHGVYKAINEFIDSNNYHVLYANESTKQWAITRG